MGLNKSYTLSFKGINNYGYEFIIPIISMNLKNIDKFTTNYKDYLSMYECLPNNLKKYIKEISGKKMNLKDEETLKKCFFIVDDNDNNYEIILRENADITYITPSELKKELEDILMSKIEFQKSLIGLKSNIDLKYRYHFFKYLYNTYMKDKEVLKMMDTYDAKKMFPTLKGDNLMIAALATDKDNLVVLLKKIGQTSEGKRDVAIKYKRLYDKINGNMYLPKEIIRDRFNEGLNVSAMKKTILGNLEHFKKEYEKEYI